MSKKLLKIQKLLFSLLLVFFLMINFLPNSIEKVQKENLQSELKTELVENIGEYDSNKIVLKNTNKELANELANRLNAKLRITSDGSFATLTLRNNETILDVVSNPDNEDILQYLSIDYQSTTTEIIEDIEEVDEHSLQINKPNYSITDPYYDKQSYLNYLNLNNIWNYTKGSNITVAVIDTGIDYDHPEFEGKISEYSYNATEDKIVKDYIDSNGNYDWSLVEDEVGHGTAVTGVIAAGMNNGIGITGIAPQVTIITIKAECSQDGSFNNTSDLVFGLYYAIERDVNVINMSFGGSGLNPYEEATRLAVDSDIICVAAAGNNSTAALTYPAADPNVIGVGALAEDSFELASYSNFGENVNVVAPGTVYTTLKDNKYGVMNGTSFSSPIVASIIALQIAKERYNYDYREFDKKTELLYASCYDLGELGCDFYYGYGAVDVNAFLLSERHKVTFNYLTDEIDNTEQVFIKNRPLQNIPEPERNYAVFDGWYYDIHCTEEYELYSDSWSDDLTLYCNWVNEDDGVPYTYVTLDDGTIEIRSYTGKRRYITIPDYIDEKEVSSIGVGAFSNETRLRVVNLPSKLKTIKDSAFSNCTNLTSITIPSSVTNIGKFAFSNNIRLYNVNFSYDSDLKTIGIYAFENCSNLSRFDIPVGVNTITGSTFIGCTRLTQVNANKNSLYYSSSNGVLYNKSKTTLILYPAGIKGETYDLPNSVNKLGESSFAFSKIKTIDLKNVVTIDLNCFTGSTIIAINIPDTVTYIGRSAFAYSLINNVILGRGVSQLNDGVFAGTSNLYEIKIPNTIQIIGRSCFEKSELKEIEFEENSQLILIGDGSFSEAKIEIINIPDSVLSIGTSAFAQSNLKIVNISDYSNLTQIGASAFYRTDIKEINLVNKLEYIGSFAFCESELRTVYIPKNVYYFASNAFASCHYLQNIYVDDDNEKYVDIDGVVYTKDLSVIYEYPAGKENTSYEINKTVTTIGKYAFYGSYNLTQMTLHEGITKVDEYGFYDCIHVQSYSLPESLEEIQEKAFSNNTRLNDITIPNNVTLISQYAFQNNKNMYYVYWGNNPQIKRLSFASFAECGIYSFEIPSNVSTISQYVFSGCTNLTQTTFKANSKLESVSAYLFNGCNNLQTITFEEGSKLTSIQAHAFEGMDKLHTINFGDAKITNIDNYAFRYCESLQSISIPQGVEEIGRYAFYGCKSLSEVTIPESVEFIGRYAFYLTNNLNVYFDSSILPLGLQENWDYGINGYYVGVKEIYTEGDFELAKLNNDTIAIIKYNGSETNLDLTNLNIGEITQIGGHAFNGSSVSTIKIPDTVVCIDRYAFANSSLTEIEIPSSVTQIADYAFYNSNITNISFEDNCNLIKIGMYAFSETSSLQKIKLPKTLKYLGSYSFLKSGITSVEFEEGINLEEIKEGTFQGTKLKTLTIPNSITLINHNAFRDISTLESVDFKEAKVQLMSNVFYNTGLKEVYIPSTLEYIGEYSFVGLRDLNEFIVDSNNPYYASKDGVLYSKDLKKLIAFPGNKTGSFMIPNHVEVIGFGAFENSKLTKVDFEEGINLLTLGYRAFYNSINLQEISIPKSVVSIDYYAFAMCKSLETVNFAYDCKLTGIYEGAFYGCISLSNIVIPDEIYEISDYAFSGCLSLEHLPISENNQVLGIYDYAFSNTGITELNLPDSLLDIGNYAFKGLDITSVVISSANKEQLVIGLGAFNECNKLEEITIPFIGASLDNNELGWFGYIFGAGNGDANATYVPVSLKKINISEGQTNIFHRAFFGLNKVESITLPSTITNIGNLAFMNCHSLNNVYYSGNIDEWMNIQFYNFDASPMNYVTKFHILKDDNSWEEIKELVISEGITEIKDNQFRNFTTIEKIILPSSLKYIGQGAFTNCDIIDSIYYQGTIDEFMNIDYYDNWNNRLKGVNHIFVFDENNEWKEVEEIIIAEGVKEIKDNEFSAFKELKRVVLPSTIERIGKNAFSGCASLETINLPSSLTYIDSGAFSGCNALKNIYYHGTNEEFMALEFCSWDSNPIRFCDNFYMLNDYGEWEIVTKIIVPEGTTEIPMEKFYNFNSLKEIYLPSTIKSFGWYAFEYCNALESVYFSGTIEDWMNIEFNSYLSNPMYYAKHFYMLDENNEWKEVEEIVVPEGTEKISECFYNFTALKTLKLPTSLKVIESNTFAGCSSLETVYIPKEIERINQDGFAGAENLKNLYYYGTLEEWFQIDFVNIWSNPMLYASHLYILNNNNEWQAVTEVVVPEGISEIEERKYYNFSDIEKVIISSGVQKIGNYAFYQCESLKDIILPASIKTINVSAFYGCEALENVYYEGTIEDWINIQFGNSNSNPMYYAKHFYMLDENNEWKEIEELVIPEGITQITNERFKNFINLRKVTIPSTMQSISLDAFSNCNLIIEVYNNTNYEIVYDRYSAIVKGKTVCAGYSIILKELFQLYSSGNFSLEMLSKHVQRKYGIYLSKQRIDCLLRNRFYIGYAYYDTVEYKHIYKTIIDEAVFYKCQDILNGKRTVSKKPTKQLVSPLRGLVRDKETKALFTPYVSRHKTLNYLKTKVSGTRNLKESDIINILKIHCKNYTF